MKKYNETLGFAGFDAAVSGCRLQTKSRHPSPVAEDDGFLSCTESKLAIWVSILEAMAEQNSSPVYLIGVFCDSTFFCSCQNCVMWCKAE